ncbi:MAG: SDR family oxidoreductase [Bacteroidetes bacterium]|nr:SDR family oxidoreductase [Bacteroidota bacterium]
MILVTGSTGQFGKAAISFLSKKMPTNQIAALARDESKAADLKAKGIDVRIGDYTDEDSMINAFKGIQKLLLVSSSDMGDRSVHHINAINAAKEAGVKHIVYTSAGIKNMTDSAISFITTAHAKTVDYLKESGITYTILNNNLYADVLPNFIGNNVIESGVFYPAGSGRVPFATREDMAEAAANVLTTKGHENQEYPISSKITYSFEDVAYILSGLSGAHIRYFDPMKEVYVEQLIKSGVPEMYVKIFAAFADAIKNNEFDIPDSTLEELLGRKSTGLKEYLHSVYFTNN